MILKGVLRGFRAGQLRDGGREPGRVLINLSWLFRLRWAAVLGQLVTIAGVAFGLGVKLPLPGLCAVVGVVAFSNLVLALWFRRLLLAGDTRAWDGRRGERLMGGILAFDLVLLAGLLHWSGGLANPFSIFFLVNLVLAAMLLPPAWTWGLTGLGLTLAFLLFVLAPGPGAILTAVPRDTLLLGHFVALAAAWLILVAFMTRIGRELEENRAALAEARERRARSERIQALATLAAGAAHELASPLSTIAVVAKELERILEEEQAGEDAVEDARLIRAEVQRCREILDKMSAESGQSKGESIEGFTVGELVEAVLAGPIDRSRVRVELGRRLAAERLRAPRESLAQAVRALIQNGFDASPEGAFVDLRVGKGAGGLLLVIEDRGSGMPAEVLERAFDPFFTTKEPGKGMGLGLFLVRAVIEEAGGELKIESAPGRGTTARVRLPLGPGAA